MSFVQVCCESWRNCVFAIWLDPCRYDSYWFYGVRWQFLAQAVHTNATQVHSVVSVISGCQLLPA